MKPKSYNQILMEMMNEYKISRQTALEWDTFGIRNLEKYFSAAGLGPKMTAAYIKMLNGKEAV